MICEPVGAAAELRDDLGRGVGGLLRDEAVLRYSGDVAGDVLLHGRRAGALRIHAQAGPGDASGLAYPRGRR